MSSNPSGEQPPGAAAPSAGLTINLSSNNPFRNRAASPASLDSAFASSAPAPTSPFDDPSPGLAPPGGNRPARPVSRNPFLDNPPAVRSPGAMSGNSEHMSLSAEDIFDSLTLDDKRASEKKPMLPPPTQRRTSDRGGDRPPAPRRGENQPPPGPSASRHRPTQSQEEALRARRMQATGSRPGASDSPQPKPQRRPRRNSDSSVMDFDARSLTEEEKRMIEAKRRERRRDAQAREPREAPREGGESSKTREGREPREGREGREGKSRTKSGKPARRLDIIDQLDATSIYGTGLFHHDGPFDALNPHRNRNTSRRAPMQAFPKDSLNNSIGGSGPLNRQPDHKTFMGHGNEEAFLDYAGGSKTKNGYAYPSRQEPAIFDPVARGDIIHGDQSQGLGTSTFLEGTPATMSAITRRQQEQRAQEAEGGIQRKKSLAQRIRHINKGQRDREFSPSGRMTNPEVGINKPSPDAGASATNDPSPFFAEFGKGEETISVRPRDGGRSPASPPPVPRRMSGSALERRVTTDATTPGDEAPPTKAMGILGRMKSLKGGRKPRITSDGPNHPPPNPGTAV